MPGSPAVVAEGLVKQFGPRRALDGVDLIATPGVHGLLGPNGAGKTTLLRVLLGLVRRDAGRLHLLGRERDRTPGPLPDGVAGFVDAPAFYPYLTGWQNLALLARLDTGLASARWRAIDEALERTGLRRHCHARVAGYSTGMRQRLGLAAALIRTPRLLLLDEPTSSLDPAGAREVRGLARELGESGATVILSSHDLDEVEALCTTLTVMNHGRVLYAGAVADLKRRGGHHYILRTSDDIRAAAVAATMTADRLFTGIRLRPRPTADEGLDVWADEPAMDTFVLALARAGVAVRALDPRGRSLESLFFELLERPGGPPPSALAGPAGSPAPDATAQPGAPAGRSSMVPA